MLKFAGHSYAMKNAREEVKEAAKFVTKLPAAENGVLDTIEKEVLGM
jgi:hydroxymethylpyrimidine pyrophosphatase-like HAD family hydrolase